MKKMIMIMATMMVVLTGCEHEVTLTVHDSNGKTTTYVETYDDHETFNNFKTK